jgi:RimJ/RimL family protein N-acetyltransferase
MMAERLKGHAIDLQSERLVLRSMTEADWDTLLKWNQDSAVLYYSEGAEVDSYCLEQIKRIYRGVSQTAICFIMELDGKPIGESWLQRMNLSRILQTYPQQDCRRIDLVIGEKACWNKGLGTETIRTLVDFGFGHERADLIFDCDIADYNPRSRRAFEKVGFRMVSKISQAPGEKAKFVYDLVITRDEWIAGQRDA